MYTIFQYIEIGDRHHETANGMHINDKRSIHDTRQLVQKPTNLTLTHINMRIYI